MADLKVFMVLLPAPETQERRSMRTTRRSVLRIRQLWLHKVPFEKSTSSEQCCFA